LFINLTPFIPLSLKGEGDRLLNDLISSLSQSTAGNRNHGRSGQL